MKLTFSITTIQLLSSILNGVFPYDWNIPKVIPLCTKGLKAMLDNYRPISIFPAINMLSENILYDQIYGYLSNSNILSKYQFGFRPQGSTLGPLFFLVHKRFTKLSKLLYANNVCRCKSSQDLSLAMNHDLNNVKD